MKVDIHGTTLQDLPKVLDGIMFVAFETEPDELEIITGTGVLQDNVKSRLEKVYHCEVRYKLGNIGALIVTL